MRLRRGGKPHERLVSVRLAGPLRQGQGWNRTAARNWKAFAAVAQLRLPDSHCALDRGYRKQRRVGIRIDRRLAAGRFRHILGKGREILAVEIAGGIGGGQYPIGLRESRPPASSPDRERATMARRRDRLFE